MYRTIRTAVATVAIVVAMLAAGSSPALADHPKPDPQPTHGTDCDNGNPWGGNHDHCVTPSPTPSSSASPQPTESPSVTPSAAPSPTPSATSRPSSPPSSAPTSTPKLTLPPTDIEGEPPPGSPETSYETMFTVLLLWGLGLIGWNIFMNAGSNRNRPNGGH